MILFLEAKENACKNSLSLKRLFVVMAGSVNSIAHSFVTGDNPLSSALALFLLQTIIIISFSRLIGQGLKYIHQPSVIAEVIGGILLGKSALSRIDVFRETLFPASSLASLKLVADVGLVLFLFLASRG